jgi:hypothetical protein
MSYSPIIQQVLDAIVDLLATNFNAQLALCGQAPLPVSAFQPLPPGDITGDTIAVAWVRDRRALDASRGNRLTIADRDHDLLFVVEVWAFGPTDQAAQACAIACAFAIEQLFDLPEHRYLGGLSDQPVVVGDTIAETAEDEQRSSLIWHLAVPLTCHVRTTRPEYQP